MGQTSSLKVKLAVLKYLQDLLCAMEPSDFQSTEDLRVAICKVVSFTSEPKSVDLRKTSQAVIVAMYNLNPHEFNTALSELPKNIVESTSRILNNNKAKNGGSGLVGDGCSSPGHGDEFYARNKRFNPFVNDYLQSDDTTMTSAQLSGVIKDIQSLNLNTNYHYLTHHKDRNSGGGGVGGGSGGLLNVGNKGELNKRLLDTLSKDSGVQSNGDVDSGKIYFYDFCIKVNARTFKFLI